MNKSPEREFAGDAAESIAKKVKNIGTTQWREVFRIATTIRTCYIVLDLVHRRL